jgi:glucose/arabinose dehydrogenase
MIRIRLLVTVLALALVFAAGSVLAQAGETTLYFPVVKNGTSLPLPPSDEAAQRISLPPGFEIRIFAQNLPGRPRFMAFGPDGHLYASLYDNGQIARLPDRNFDGLSDGTEIAASGLTLPHGIEFHDGWLYVAEGDKVERLADMNGNGSYETKELVTGNIPGPAGHSTRTVHFGPDGKMYVSAGSSSNATPETDPRRAAILRFNANGTIPADNPFFNDPDVNKRPLYAWGLRNSVDFLWSPGGLLWADHNGSDGLGDNVPPEEVVIPVQANASHGWPYCYTPGLGVTGGPEVRDTNVMLPPGFTCAQAIPAIYTVPAHSAPLGMTLASGNNFPPAYQNSLYLALHGSWNTTTGSIRDCKVERVLLSNGQPASNQTFATGWRAPGLPCGNAATWGRPADVIFGPYGEMYISDDHGDRIYRVVYVGN